MPEGEWMFMDGMMAKRRQTTRVEDICKSRWGKRQEWIPLALLWRSVVCLLFFLLAIFPFLAFCGQMKLDASLLLPSPCDSLDSTKIRPPIIQSNESIQLDYSTHKRRNEIVLVPGNLTGTEYW